MVEPIATVGFVMSQKMLRGVRARAEADPIAKVARPPGRWQPVDQLQFRPVAD